MRKGFLRLVSFRPRPTAQRRQFHHSSPLHGSPSSFLPKSKPKSPSRPYPNPNPSFPLLIYDPSSPWAFLTRFRIKIVYPMAPVRSSGQGGEKGPYGKSGATGTKGKAAYYAVVVGRRPGVYKSWAECEAAVKGYKDAIYKKFSSVDQAESYVKQDPALFRNNKLLTPEEIAQARTQGSGSSSKPGGLRPFFSADPGASSPSDLPPTSTSAPPSAPTSHPLTPTAQKAFAAGFTLSPTGHLVVYTDGSSRGNGQKGSKAGCGVWWGDGAEVRTSNVSERVPGELQTNNRGELLAIIRALEVCPFLDMPIEIRTDSQYAISCITKYLPGWIRNNFRTSTGGQVLNVDMIVHLLALINQREKGNGVKFTHVRGHEGEVGNEAADRLANLGALAFPVPDRKDWLSLEDANRAAADSARRLREKKSVEPEDNIVDVECEIEPSWLMSEEEIAELNAD